MFQIRYEGRKGSAFPNNQQAATSAACLAVNNFSTGAILFPANFMIEWFGTATDAKLKENLKRMDSVIKDGSRTVTFVQGSGIDLQVQYNAENVLQPPVLAKPNPPGVPNAPPGPGAGQFYGFAFPTNATGKGESGTSTHVGSGMRIYLGSIYFSLALNSPERPQTVYHEMTHKVLATNDHVYGAAACRALAISDSAKAMKNADNYGYFVTSLNGHVW